jgi:hypothetical protein
MTLVPFTRPRPATPRRSSATITHSAFPFVSPIKGIDVSQPMPGGNPLTAIRMDNLIPRALGCVLRAGYLRWVSNLGAEVRSLMQYHPALGDPKLFAATSQGKVFDVTTQQPSSFVPTPVLTIASGAPQGEWTSLNYTTDAGVHYLCAVNQAGGYWTFDGTTWVEHINGTGPGQISGVNPRLFCFVMVYKRHLCFIEADSTRMWYLPSGQIAGVAEQFDFGALFPNGGELCMLVNWTFDGSAAGTGAAGGGLDNKLVIIADQGDVLVYSGELVSETTEFALSGRWFIGRVPVGRRFASQYSSDVAMLSERGMCFASEMMRGQGFFTNAQMAQHINSDLAVQISNTLDVRYWEVKFLPHEQLILIKLPKYQGLDKQWCYEVNNAAFASLLDIPMNTVDTFDGKTFSGDYTGNVWRCFAGESDGAVDTTPGKDLQGTVVTSFQPLGDPVRVKRFLMVKPSFSAPVAPGVQARLNAEWNLGLPGSAPAFIASGDSLWDGGAWDIALWSGEGSSFESWTGAVGTGRYASLAMRVRGASGTIFVGWQALAEAGGIL